MPPPEHLRITYSGTLGPSVAAATEIWSCNISSSLADAGFPTRVSTAALALALSPHWSNLVPNMYNVARMTNTRVAWIGADGHVVKDVTGAYVQGDFASDVPGAVAGRAPFQISWVMGLKTVVPGQVGRGRFYMPQPSLTNLQDTGRMSLGATQAANTALQGFLEDLNDTLALQAGQRVVVASGGAPTQAIPPALYDVVFCEVGDVLDTQRRRRGALEEVRQVLPVAP